MKKQFIFSTIILFAAITMVSCGKRHAPRTIALNDMNDSINYVIGQINGAGIRQFYMQDVTDIDAAVRAFINALDKAFNNDADPDEMYQTGMSLGNWFKQMETDGLMGEADLKANTKLLRQGLEAGLKGTSEWSSADAQDFIQRVMQQIQEEKQAEMFNFDIDDLFFEEELIEIE